MSCVNVWLELHTIWSTCNNIEGKTKRPAMTKAPLLGYQAKAPGQGTRPKHQAKAPG